MFPAKHDHMKSSLAPAFTPAVCKLRCHYVLSLRESTLGIALFLCKASYMVSAVILTWSQHSSQGQEVDTFLVQSCVVCDRMCYLTPEGEVARVFITCCRKWLLILRGSLGFGVACSLYWSLLYLPLSDALVFIFLSPLLVAAFSPVFNKELPSM